jgi:hypothetical protein
VVVVARGFTITTIRTAAQYRSQAVDRVPQPAPTGSGYGAAVSAVADSDDLKPARPPTSLIVAIVVVVAQSLALAILGLILVVKAATGHPHSLAGALGGAGFALAGAFLLGACARAMLALRPAARTPIVVVELLALPVSYSLTFQAHRPGYGAPILLSALIVLYLVFTPAVRAVLDREN